MDIGKRIRQLRVQNGLTQGELASRCELTIAHDLGAVGFTIPVEITFASIITIQVVKNPCHYSLVQLQVGCCRVVAAGGFAEDAVVAP